MIGPILIAALVFGAIDQHGALARLSALLLAVFEFALRVWLIVKGFDLEAVAALESKQLRGQPAHTRAPA